jgi:hypothetical protein
VREILSNGGKTVDRSIECVEIFGFLNGICEAEKSERSWESIAWELREFSKKIKKNTKIDTV